MQPIMEWRTCIGFPHVEVSECGDLRKAKTGERIKGYVTFDGYIAYRLRNPEGIRFEVFAHVLVIEAFKQVRPGPEYQVAHNNGSRLFNHPSNLRWATVTENQRDRIGHGTAPEGEANGRAKITEADVHFIRAEYRRIKASAGARSVTELESRFGLHRATVVNIATGRAWKHIPMPERDAQGFALI